MGGRLRGGQGRPLEYLTAVGRLKESPEPRLLASAATAAVSSAPGFWFVALSRLCAQSATHDAHHRELDADVGRCWRGGVRCQRRVGRLVVRLALRCASGACRGAEERRRVSEGAEFVGGGWC